MCKTPFTRIKNLCIFLSNSFLLRFQLLSCCLYIQETVCDTLFFIFSLLSRKANTSKCHLHSAENPKCFAWSASRGENIFSCLNSSEPIYIHLSFLQEKKNLENGNKLGWYFFLPRSEFLVHFPILIFKKCLKSSVRNIADHIFFFF